MSTRAVVLCTTALVDNIVFFIAGWRSKATHRTPEQSAIAKSSKHGQSPKKSLHLF
jgi:hypothetical protein